MIFSVMWCLLKAHNDHIFNNINWSVSRVLHEANAIDKAYCMAIEQDPVTHIPPQPRLTCLQISVGPRIICDASVGIQGATTPNQTDIGIFILTTLAESVFHCRCFVNLTSKFIRLPRCSRKMMVASK